MPEGKEEWGLIYRTLREDILVWNILVSSQTQNVV